MHQISDLKRMGAGRRFDHGIVIRRDLDACRRLQIRRDGPWTCDVAWVNRRTAEGWRGDGPVGTKDCRPMRT